MSTISAHPVSPIEFNEDTIRAIFGHEAAEDETIERLKSYYLKTNIYNSMKSQIPLLILVGHKGVGKSALLKVLASEDGDEGRIPITVQPNDIFDLDVSEANFLKKIEIWKNGLATIIFNKLVQSLNDPITSRISNQTFAEWCSRFNKLLLATFGKKLTDLQTEAINLSKEVTPQSLAAFLYKINFITARKSTGSEILRVYYDENQYIYNDFTDFGYSYEIHPAYRWALQPSSPAALFRQIELLESDDQP